MKKETIEIALYNRVKLTNVWNNVYSGWLVRDNHNPNKYAILPLNMDCIFTFSASYIKSIQYLSNGYILK